MRKEKKNKIKSSPSFTTLTLSASAYVLCIY